MQLDLSDFDLTSGPPNPRQTQYLRRTHSTASRPLTSTRKPSLNELVLLQPGEQEQLERMLVQERLDGQRANLLNCRFCWRRVCFNDSALRIAVERPGSLLFG